MVDSGLVGRQLSGLSSADGVDTGCAYVSGRRALAPELETVERIREALLSERRDIVVAGLVKELLDFLLTDGKAAEAEFDPLHR